MSKAQNIKDFLMKIKYDNKGNVYEYITEITNGKHLVYRLATLDDESYNHGDEIDLNNVYKIETVFNGALYDSPLQLLVLSNLTELEKEKEKLENDINDIKIEYTKEFRKYQDIRDERLRTMRSVETDIYSSLSKLQSMEIRYIAHISNHHGVVVESLNDALQIHDQLIKPNFAALVLRYDGESWTLAQSRYHDGSGSSSHEVWLGETKEDAILNVAKHYIDANFIDDIIYKMRVDLDDSVFKLIQSFIDGGVELDEDLLSAFNEVKTIKHQKTIEIKKREIEIIKSRIDDSYLTLEKAKKELELFESQIH